MKKILVTGGAGFIGSNLIRMMLDEHDGYEVVNLDVLSYSGNLENRAGCEDNPRYTFVKGDVSDPDTAAKAIEGCDAVDVVVGPGNRWVTAAKQLLSGVVGIDMLAGPSELLVLADETAEPALIAADLLAQAEHDTDARAILVTTDRGLLARVDVELRAQLAALPTAAVARVALGNGFAVVCDDLELAIEISDRIAPEDLEIMTADASGVASRIRNAGGVCVGAGSAEVLGDYGAGPNHTLPTGGTARSQAGLSVSHFLRLRTWLRVDDADAASEMVADTAAIARAEGLIGHERSALHRGLRSPDE